MTAAGHAVFWHRSDPARPGRQFARFAALLIALDLDRNISESGSNSSRAGANPRIDGPSKLSADLIGARFFDAQVVDGDRPITRQRP